MASDTFIEELGLCPEVPIGEKHPLVSGHLATSLEPEQIILGEVQHYLRIRTNPIFFGYMAVNAVSDKNYELMQTILENFMEELGGERTHVDIMLQFLEEGGISREEADRAEPAPGTLAAIEMITGCCQRRSALEGVAMLAFVESQLGGAGKVSEKVYRELTGHYGSHRAAETYSLHAEEDEGHGTRQIDAIRLLANDTETQDKVRAAVKSGLRCLHFRVGRPRPGNDREREFWSGVTGLSYARPPVRLPESRRRCSPRSKFPGLGCQVRVSGFGSFSSEP